MSVEETIEKITFDSNSHSEWKFTLFMNLIICSISNMYYKFDHEITLVKTILNSVQSIKIYLKQKSLFHYPFNALIKFDHFQWKESQIGANNLVVLKKISNFRSKLFIVNCVIFSLMFVSVF
jgi:hypothetical protein